MSNIWRKNNPEKAREYDSKYYKEHKVQILKYSRQYNKKYRRDNREKGVEYNKKWIRNNPEKRIESDRQYFKKHKVQIQENRKTNLKLSLNNRIGTEIRKSIKGNKNGRHWEDLVGYKSKDLIKRLKRTMPEGYTWKDFLSGKLHIDHIIPIKVFNFDKPEYIDFKRCWALSNLQLLKDKENMIKSDKIDKPFQPALRI